MTPHRFPPMPDHLCDTRCEDWPGHQAASTTVDTQAEGTVELTPAQADVLRAVADEQVYLRIRDPHGSRIAAAHRAGHMSNVHIYCDPEVRQLMALGLVSPPPFGVFFYRLTGAAEPFVRAVRAVVPGIGVVVRPKPSKARGLVARVAELEAALDKERALSRRALDSYSAMEGKCTNLAATIDELTEERDRAIRTCDAVADTVRDLRHGQRINEAGLLADLSDVRAELAALKEATSAAVDRWIADGRIWHWRAVPDA